MLAILNGAATHHCVPLQGSGTFAVEAAIGTLVPRDGKVLVLINGAYGKRLAKICEVLGRSFSTFETAEDQPTTAADVSGLTSIFSAFMRWGCPSPHRSWPGCAVRGASARLFRLRRRRRR